MKTKTRKRPLLWSGRAIWRLAQRLTGIHRIHHSRFSYGWKLPIISWAYFPPWTTRGDNPKTYRHGWQRVLGRGRDYHDCTATGVY